MSSESVQEYRVMEYISRLFRGLQPRWSPRTAANKRVTENHETPPPVQAKFLPSGDILLLSFSRLTRVPGNSSAWFNLLHRTCKLVALLCFLHILVSVFFYVTSLDLRFAFTQSQQSIQNHQNQTQQSSQQSNQNQNQSSHPSRVRLNLQNNTTLPGEKYTTEGLLGLPHDQARPNHTLEACPETSPLLVGPLRVEFNLPVSLETVKKENPSLQPGGRYRPTDCVALQKVAIIIPFRNREEHLRYWLYYLHPLLQRQQLDYGVYVINQEGLEVFNRAKLFNVGYTEALKEYDYQCFVFSDVDLIPMDDRNIYKCFSQPRHLSVSIDKFGFRLPYPQNFGGVSSVSKDQFLKINGFPNNYWGWGGEDDDIYNRLTSKGMSISRPSGETGKCRMIRHNRDKHNEDNPQRFDRITHTRETMDKDGINSLSYKVVHLEKRYLYTWVSVDVGKP